MEQQKIRLIRSDTWLTDNFVNIDAILEDTIKEYVSDNDRIVNIQVLENSSGLKRFWIYVESQEVKNG